MFDETLEGDLTKVFEKRNGVVKQIRVTDSATQYVINVEWKKVKHGGSYE